MKRVQLSSFAQGRENERHGSQRVRWGGNCLKNIGHGSRLGARQIKNGERLAVNR